jgi:Spy/CpxP family protein refolding chaperone
VICSNQHCPHALQESLMNTPNRAMNRTRTILIASLATAGLAGFAAQAATTTDATPTASGTHAWHGHHHGGHFMHVLKQLNLTAEQQTQIHGILAAAKTQFQSLRSSSHSTNEAMEAMSPTDSGYPALLATAKANAAKRRRENPDLLGAYAGTDRADPADHGS